MTVRPEVSVVVPLYNESLNVEQLHREMSASLAALGRPYEVILVDDGSTDGTAERLRAIEDADPRVRVLRLRRNFGQTAAFSAGFDHAQGDVVVTSDGDLQNDPADIPSLVAKLEDHPKPLRTILQEMMAEAAPYLLSEMSGGTR